MRILEITGYDDFSAIAFSGEHVGASVTEILDNIDGFQPEEEEEWVLKTHSIEGSLTIKDIEMIRSNFIDHDHQKRQIFYIEGEIIKH